MLRVMAERRLMNAVQYDSYGGGAAALKHVEVPIPTPGKGEVLLKIEARSLNPFDCRIQSGIIRPFLPSKFPYIPATDVAGEVMEVGSGVKNFKPGNKVVAVLSARNGGGLGEYAVAKENSVIVARPPEVSAAEAAGLPIAGVTAYLALTEAAGINLDDPISPKKNILVTAASGGVGHYAVQLAKLANLHHVTATCGPRNIDFVRSLGADEVVDYTTPEGTNLRSPSGLKYDVVIHCARGIPWSTFKANLSKNGKVIDLTPNPKAFCTFALHKLTFSKKQLLPCIITPKSESLAWLVGLVKEGKLKTTVDSKHPLSKAEDAWAKMMSGHATGKIIVEP
nr:putative quinone-oxidoreductase homolog, chloroplastic [Ipomoea trifida]